MGISYGAISQLFTAQTRSARPRGDLAAVDDRRDRDDAVPRRHPQHRLRGRLGAAAPGGGRAGRAEQRPAVRLQQIQHGRSDLQGKPGPPRRGGEPDGQDPRQLATTYPSVADPLDPITFVNKIKVPVFMACQWEDEQTGGHCPDLVAALHRDAAQVVHVHQRRARRLARPVHVRPLVRLPRAVRRPQAPIVERGGRYTPPRRSSTSRRWVSRTERHAAGGPDPARADLRVRAGRVRGAARGPGAVRQRRGHLARPASNRRATRIPGFEQSFSTLPGPRHDRALTGTSGPAARCSAQPPQREGINWYTSNAKALPLNDFTVANTEAGGLWGNASQWQWNWQQNPPGTAVSYVSAPLKTEHHGDRRRRGPRVGAVLDAGRRPPGDDQRGAAGRQRDVRAERLDASRRAQARDERRTTSCTRRARCSSRSRACSPPTSSRCRRAGSSRS